MSWAFLHPFRQDDKMKKMYMICNQAIASCLSLIHRSHLGGVEGINLVNPDPNCNDTARQ
jgi:hypothetical protein